MQGGALLDTTEVTMPRGEKGQTLVEYGLVLSLVSVALITALELLRDHADKYYVGLTDLLGKLI